MFKLVYRCANNDFVICILEANGPCVEGGSDHLYKNNGAYSTMTGQLVFLFWYLSGVIQGCPGSAFLFDVALDPFLAAFEKILELAGRGILRACADDIGVAVKSLSAFKYMFPIFNLAES